MNSANTPYDDVFRTLLNDCTWLILPVINEVFGEHYTGREKILFAPNEHFLNQQDGDETKRITDNSFQVLGTEPKKYHWECQSTTDSSMLVRFFEYDSQIALDEGELSGNVLTVTFPHSAALFLRCTRSTPDTLQILIQVPNGSIAYTIPVMKIKRYTIDEIFEKRLLFLIPFHIFSYEEHFKEYQDDTEKLEALKSEYARIRGRLEALADRQEIDEFTKRTIIDMSNKVVENIAAKFDPIREGVKSVMGGKVLEHEAKNIRNEGRQEGRKEGRQEGRQEGRKEGRKEGILLTGQIFRKVKDNPEYTNRQIALELNCSIDEVESTRKMFDI